MANKSARNLDRAEEAGRMAANTGAPCPYNPGSAKAEAWEYGRQREWLADDIAMSRPGADPDGF